MSDTNIEGISNSGASLSSSTSPNEKILKNDLGAAVEDNVNELSNLAGSGSYSAPQNDKSSPEQHTFNRENISADKGSINTVELDRNEANKLSNVEGKLQAGVNATDGSSTCENVDKDKFEERPTKCVKKNADKIEENISVNQEETNNREMVSCENKVRRRSGSRDRIKMRQHGRSPNRRTTRKRSHSRSPSYKRSASKARRQEEQNRRHADRRGRDNEKLEKRRSKKYKSRSPEISPNRSKTSSTSKDISSTHSKIENDNATVTHPAAKITERQRRAVDLLTSRTGGAYIPPAKLRMMQAEITDKSSAAYQRIAWEALKKSIHGYINKVNVDNIAIITRELLKENIVRGRGLLCRSIIQAQTASPTFTHVYAALVSIINSKFPNIGELLLNRLVIQFKRAFRRNDKAVCLSSSRFIAHLVNQRVAHEILALEILTLLVETPTDDSVEVAIAFLKECGMKLTEVSSKGIGAIFEMLKNILHEGKLDKRVQYMIEVVFQVRKDGFKDHQSVIESLELVEEDDQFTHLLMLDEATNPEDALNAFKFDEQYETNEDKYKGLSKEILGSEASDSDHGSGSDSESESGDSSDSAQKNQAGDQSTTDDIIDNTETNLIALRRTIYLTINSSLDYEECAHKLMKMQLKPGQEVELCHMFLDCCAEQRTYEKFYGLLAQRFCSINKIYIEPFEEIFKDTYQTTHRLDTNRLRNVSKFFSHLLFTDAIGWDVLECIKLNEDDTTSSSRIFIKILFQELAEYMGLGKLNNKLKDPVLTESLVGLFPKDNPRNTRFAINFFTSIGLGGLTDELRQFLKNAPKSVPAINIEILATKLEQSSSSSSSSSTESSSSSSESSSSSSDTSDSNKRKSKKLKNKHTKKSTIRKHSHKRKQRKPKVSKNKKKKRNEESSTTSEGSSESNESSNCESSSDSSTKSTAKSRAACTKKTSKARRTNMDSSESLKCKAMSVKDKKSGVYASDKYADRHGIKNKSLEKDYEERERLNRKRKTHFEDRDHFANGEHQKDLQRRNHRSRSRSRERRRSRSGERRRSRDRDHYGKSSARSAHNKSKERG